MEEYWIIILYKGFGKQYFIESDNDQELYMMDKIWVEDIWSCTRFKFEQEAIDKLLDGIWKYHWGGLFQIEKIYISR